MCVCRCCELQRTLVEGHAHVHVCLQRCVLALGSLITDELRPPQRTTARVIPAEMKCAFF